MEAAGQGAVVVFKETSSCERFSATPFRARGRSARMGPTAKAKMNPLAFSSLRGLANGLGLAVVGEGRNKGPDVIYWVWAVCAPPAPERPNKLPPSWLILVRIAPASLEP